MPDVLDIDGVATTSRAFRPVDLAPLEATILRGQNRIISLRAGRRSKSLTLDENEATLEWRLNGIWGPTGTVFGDYEVGVRTNLNTYRAIFMVGADAKGEKPAVLHTALGDLAAQIQVVTFDPVTTGPSTRTILTRIRVPEGQWT